MRKYEGICGKYEEISPSIQTLLGLTIFPPPLYSELCPLDSGI